MCKTIFATSRQSASAAPASSIGTLSDVVHRSRSKRVRPERCQLRADRVAAGPWYRSDVGIEQVKPFTQACQHGRKNGGAWRQAITRHVFQQPRHVHRGRVYAALQVDGPCRRSDSYCGAIGTLTARPGQSMLFYLLPPAGRALSCALKQPLKIGAQMPSLPIMSSLSPA